jgi:tetratricopeptide (TPR) repeat protein
LTPQLPQAYYQLSLISAQQRNYPEEIRFLKKAISLDPGNEEYHYRLAFAYRNSGDEAKFREELNEFQRLHNANSDGQ